MLDQRRFYINGQWVSPRGREQTEIISPSSEERLAYVALGNEEDADSAVQAARMAFDAWSQTPAVERAAVLEKAQSLLAARADELTELIAKEVGMPIQLARPIQVGLPVANLGVYAQIARGFEWEQTVDNSRVVREAAGVVVAITPWNYPLHQIVAKVAPALAAGCTVVLKPSEIAPLNAIVLAEVLHEAGIPPGVFNLVNGVGLLVGETLVTHPEVDLVSFTGSTRAGQRIAALAAQTVKRVSLELGGKSASVLMPCADFAVAVPGTLQSCFLNSGQTCSAHTRMIVPLSRYEEAVEIAVEAAKAFKVGDPLDPTAFMGPVVSSTQRDRVRDHIARAQLDGAVLLHGGVAPPAGFDRGWYVSPTIFGNVDSRGQLAQQEIFGPVLAIQTYDDSSESEAVALANGSIYGLGGAVWAGSEERAVKVARRIRTGQVHINGGQFNLRAPFGGYKQSGHGRELGLEGLHEFLELKAMHL